MGGDANGRKEIRGPAPVNGRGARTAPAFSLGRVGEWASGRAYPVCGHPSLGAAPSKRATGSRVCPEGVGRQVALDAGGSVKILGRRGRAAYGDGPTDLAWYGLCLLLFVVPVPDAELAERPGPGRLLSLPHRPLRGVVLVLVDGHELVGRLEFALLRC
jgi:hypothetical protein